MNNIGFSNRFNFQSLNTLKDLRLTLSEKLLLREFAFPIHCMSKTKDFLLIEEDLLINMLRSPSWYVSKVESP